uniref:uncharacterized protein n=1 Tax=Myxine glutinosa TaxID=7769 RepID=UPI00358F23F1
MFLANDDNKKQMCQLLLKVWSGQEAATRLERTEMAVLIVEGKAHQLASTNGKVEVRELPTIYSNQEETDTRVVLYLHHAATIGYKNAVVRTPDTDILLILLHHAHNIKLTVYLDTGSGKHRQLVNVSELAESLGEDYCATLLGYYVFSGEDCTSAFKGKGKVGPLKKLEKNPRFHRAFGELGDNWDANPEYRWPSKAGPGQVIHAPLTLTAKEHPGEEERSWYSGRGNRTSKPHLPNDASG